MPIFILVVLLNQIDRQNINYAALTMNRSVHHTCSGAEYSTVGLQLAVVSAAVWQNGCM
jgi:hypothetical protein